MQFSADQIVVHPHNGPATITEIASQTIESTPVPSLWLAVHRSDLTIGVPVEKADEIGLRKVYDTAELTQLFGVLHAPPATRRRPGPAVQGQAGEAAAR